MPCDDPDAAHDNPGESSIAPSSQVAPDFSELPSVVKRLLRDPAGMQRMADAAFARVVEASDERNFAAEVAMMLQTALS